MMVTDSGGTKTHVYSYDNIYQITAVDYPAGFEYLATDTTFAYDAAGNRTSVIDGSGTSTYTANALNQYTAAGSVTYQSDTSGNMTYDGHYLYRYDPENRLTKVKKFEQGPGELALGCDTDLTFTTGGSANWTRQTTGGTFENDCVKSGAIGQGQESWMQTTISGSGTLTFYWQVYSDVSDDLKFYIDGQLQNEMSGINGWTQRSYYLSSGGTHTLKWSYVKVSGGAWQDTAYVDRVVWTPSWPAGRTLADAVDSFLTYTTGGNSNWFVGGDGYFDVDDAKSGDLDYGQSNWLQTTVTGPGTFKFWWKTFTDNGGGGNDLSFRIDGVWQSSIDGEQGWQQKTYTITGTGAHTLTWTYSRGSQDNNGWGWVDYVQWSGPLPQDPPATGWRELVYVYDASGRRIEKKYNNVTVLKYIYDGDSCIAEYDAGSNLRRKYIYGPGIDQPVCMIEATVSPSATYYYHFDALGSVVALTNSSGNTVEVYDYSVYGQVGASDATHPNRFTFTGREFDKETGLYYYRARYYNPQIGRFLQTDPIGYGDGMGWYGYCGNSPIGRTDPTGRWAGYNFQWVNTGGGPRLAVQCLNADGGVGTDFYFGGWNDLFAYVNGTGNYTRPGDFCDGSFDHAVFMSSIDAAQAADPTYGPAGRRIPTGDCQSSLANAVDSVMGALPSDQTLYTIGNTSLAVSITASGAVIMIVTAGGATPLLLDAEGLLAGGDAAVSGTTLARALGAAGEATVTALYDIGTKTAILLGGQTLVPDGWTRSTISEVKNVAYQGWTQQLVDYSVYALMNGMRFDLYVRSGTELSPLLQGAAARGLVNIIRVPGMGM